MTADDRACVTHIVILLVPVNAETMIPCCELMLLYILPLVYPASSVLVYTVKHALCPKQWYIHYIVYFLGLPIYSIGTV